MALTEKLAAAVALACLAGCAGASPQSLPHPASAVPAHASAPAPLPSPHGPDFLAGLPPNYRRVTVAGGFGCRSAMVARHMTAMALRDMHRFAQDISDTSRTGACRLLRPGEQVAVGMEPGRDGMVMIVDRSTTMLWGPAQLMKMSPRK